MAELFSGWMDGNHQFKHSIWSCPFKPSFLLNFAIRVDAVQVRENLICSQTYRIKGEGILITSQYEPEAMPRFNAELIKQRDEICEIVVD